MDFVVETQEKYKNKKEWCKMDEQLIFKIEIIIKGFKKGKGITM